MEIIKLFFVQNCPFSILNFSDLNFLFFRVHLEGQIVLIILVSKDNTVISFLLIIFEFYGGGQITVGTHEVSFKHYRLVIREEIFGLFSQIVVSGFISNVFNDLTSVLILIEFQHRIINFHHIELIIEVSIKIGIEVHALINNIRNHSGACNC